MWNTIHLLLEAIIKMKMDIFSPRKLCFCTFFSKICKKLFRVFTYNLKDYSKSPKRIRPNYLSWRRQIEDMIQMNKFMHNIKF